MKYWGPALKHILVFLIVALMIMFTGIILRKYERYNFSSEHTLQVGDDGIPEWSLFGDYNMRVRDFY